MAVIDGPIPHGWIGIDLDGTLAMDNEVPFPQIGTPIPAMVDRVKQFLADGWDVRIFTARAARTDVDSYKPYYNGTAEQFHEQQEQLITEWCIQHLGCALPITATKDFQMVQLWDDRAVSVMTNTGMTKIEWLDANV